MILKNLLLSSAFLLVSIGSAQNLITTDSWITHTPTNTLSDFDASGGAGRNFIKDSIANPFGQNDPLWLSKPDNTYQWLGFKTKQLFTNIQVDVT